jgi:hypothetical protein
MARTFNFEVLPLFPVLQPSASHRDRPMNYAAH